MFLPASSEYNHGFETWGKSFCRKPKKTGINVDVFSLSLFVWGYNSLIATWEVD